MTKTVPSKSDQDAAYTEAVAALVRLAEALTRCEGKFTPALYRSVAAAVGDLKLYSPEVLGLPARPKIDPEEQVKREKAYNEKRRQARIDYLKGLAKTARGREFLNIRDALEKMGVRI